MHLKCKAIVLITGMHPLGHRRQIMKLRVRGGEIVQNHLVALIACWVLDYVLPVPLKLRPGGRRLVNERDKCVAVINRQTQWRHLHKEADRLFESLRMAVMERNSQRQVSAAA